MHLQYYKVRVNGETVERVSECTATCGYCGGCWADADTGEPLTLEPELIEDGD